MAFSHIHRMCNFKLAFVFLSLVFAMHLFHTNLCFDRILLSCAENLTNILLPIFMLA